MSKKIIYLSWIAVNNDPYKWKDNNRRLDESENPLWKTDDVGNREIGPTLNFFKNADKWRQNIHKFHLFFNEHHKISQLVVDKLKEELREPFQALYNQDPRIKIIDEKPEEDFNPTDHKFLLEFMRDKIKGLTQNYPPDKYDGFYINLSPGTPAMHSIWLIIANEGHFTDYEEFELFQGVRGPKVVGTVDQDWMGETLFSQIKKVKSGELPPSEKLPLNDFKNKKMKQIHKDLKQSIQVKIPTLFLGETGTGKTFMAKTLHNMYCVSQGKNPDETPFERVMLSEFLEDEDTMRSELLGYKKGAFSGADEDYEGAVKRADGGTLFLDELWDIPKNLQEILLQVLEHGEFKPKGAKKTEKSDFNLTLATLYEDEIRNPQKRNEQIRKDFWFRIRGNIISILPLRDLREDIKSIWKFQFHEAQKKLLYQPEIHIDETTHDFISEQLKNLKLPGNHRDIEAIALQLLRRNLLPEPTDCLTISKEDAKETLEYYQKEIAS